MNSSKENHYELVRIRR